MTPRMLLAAAVLAAAAGSFAVTHAHASVARSDDRAHHTASTEHTLSAKTESAGTRHVMFVVDNSGTMYGR
ncbi:hypothetical protein ACFCXK_09335 [Streptomyces sp. NPDC056269]|uniref:hypothetical protein n=1 Tax=Streptomyces sp. NPDC056269 TaxID=3345768 RepID=UPI0035D62C38